MKIIDVEQGTEDWFTVRAGIPTASEFDSLISPLWKAREGQGVETYLNTKLAERWLNAALHDFGSGAMEQGTMRESEAVDAIAFELDCDIRRVGFITTDDGRVGCSPDGINDDGGFEIKCPQPAKHLQYLRGGSLPKEYAAQVYGGMLVTGLPQWTFISYHPSFPMFRLTVPWDASIIDSIRQAVEAFNVRLEQAYAELLKMGEPRAAAKARWSLEFATTL